MGEGLHKQWCSGGVTVFKMLLKPSEISVIGKIMDSKLGRWQVGNCVPNLTYQAVLWKNYTASIPTSNAQLCTWENEA